jgi:shikimate dehydrogenase
MQNAGINALGLDWRYLAFAVHPDDLRSALAGAKAMKFVGLNLTVPHKLLAMNMVDALDESARHWGAVNTIRFEGLDATGAWQPIGRLEPESTRELRSVGFNTDADAVVQSLCKDLSLDLRGKRVLILGAGGAGSVAALRIAGEQVKRLYLVNRTPSKAEEVAQQVRDRHPGTEVIVGYPPGAVDLILNATSLGLKQDDPLPFDQQQFDLKQAAAAYDMIYRPTRTRLLEAAQAAGCRVANGLGMLLYQGAKAQEIWTGQPAPIAVMKQALESNVYGE